ncbi:hypothetical protein BY458DRAFT_489681 [Sporodiniella umbellata]|nr:hypothetical protein BY458DRAFT_489681 [Sporodiniella umbellata]
MSVLYSNYRFLISFNIYTYIYGTHGCCLGIYFLSRFPMKSYCDQRCLILLQLKKSGRSTRLFFRLLEDIWAQIIDTQFYTSADDWENRTEMQLIFSSIKNQISTIIEFQPMLV